MKDKNQDIKEDFCGACVSVIPALIGAGGIAGSSSGMRGAYNSTKKIVFIASIVLIIISIIIFIYYKNTCKDCR